MLYDKNRSDKFSPVPMVNELRLCILTSTYPHVQGLKKLLYYSLFTIKIKIGLIF